MWQACIQIADRMAPLNWRKSLFLQRNVLRFSKELRALHQETSRPSQPLVIGGFLCEAQV